MSTADSYLIVSVQTCVHDIYKVFKPDIPEKKELRLTRVFAFVLPLGALVIALYIKNAYNILMFAWSFYAAAAGLPAFAALYWKKATKAGIISGMAAGFVCALVGSLSAPPLALVPRCQALSPAPPHWWSSALSLTERLPRLSWIPITRRQRLPEQDSRSSRIVIRILRYSDPFHFSMLLFMPAIL